MSLALTLVSPDPAATAEAVSHAHRLLAAERLEVKEERPLGPGATDLRLTGCDLPALKSLAAHAAAGLPVDWAAQHADGRRKRLLIADMDSTIIGCEGLDEIADYAGLKGPVAEITERAMRGELAFEPGLRERVALLEGLSAEVLDRCYRERVRLSPGAETLVRTMAANGARCLLVSGGFDVFARPVAQAAGFHAFRANRLELADGRLTGRVFDPILGAEAKLGALGQETAAADLSLDDALAVGDGANDLPMIRAAGLGVAHRAKPVVAAEADARVDHADLTALLYFQGYEAAAFVTARSGRP